MPAFGDRLRLERRRLGYGLRQLAEATGAFGAPPVPASVVARWQHAEHGLRGDALALLVRLSFDVPFLLTGTPDHAHHLAPSDGLGLAVPMARLYDAHGAPWWPTPITWTPADALTAAQLHRRASGGRRLLAQDIAEAATVRLAARARVSWAIMPPEAATRRLAAIGARWLADFDVARLAGAPVSLTAIVDATMRVITVAEQRAA